MKLTARDVMVKEFDTVQSDAPIETAVKLILKGRVRSSGHTTVSILVTDHFGHLVGVLSMVDILYHLRPPILHYMGDSISFENQELESYIRRFRGLTVDQVMSSPVRYVSPDDDLMMIIDRMVREKCRRLPVVENSSVIGVVYLPEVYMHLCKRWLKIE